MTIDNKNTFIHYSILTIGNKKADIDRYLTSVNEKADVDYSKHQLLKFCLSI